MAHRGQRQIDREMTRSDRLITVVARAVNFIDKLRAASVKITTIRAYRKGVLTFLQWVSEVAPHSRFRHLDRLCADYGQAVFTVNSRRGALQQFLYTFHGLEFFIPSVRGRLFLSRQASAGWDNLVPSKSPPPFSRDIMLACAAVMRSAAKCHPGLSCHCISVSRIIYLIRLAALQYVARYSCISS